MRYFPFKILFLCILIPPVVHQATVAWLKSAFSNRYTKQIEKICAGDINRLLEGHIALKDAMGHNVDVFLDQRSVLEKKMQVTVTIITRTGQMLYPVLPGDGKGSLLSQNQGQVAEDNYRMLNEGFDVKVSVVIDPYSPVSSILLVFYVTLSLGILYYFYRAGIKQSKKDEEGKEQQWALMVEREEHYRNKLGLLSNERKEMDQRLAEMKGKLSEISRTEDGLIEEIVSLEKKIEQNESLRKNQQEEIQELKSAIEKNRVDKKARLKQKVKGYDATEKRLKTLYKNLSFHDRAVDGFRDLEEDMKLKCEELIHLLNDESDKVIIKRKVFGKKNRETVFEVNFAYNGRLYFRKTRDGMPEILAVGTKNTQERELEFLDRL